MPERMASSARETSPHAWSRYGYPADWVDQLRNISTCVEQICQSLSLKNLVEKHLHMRGADRGMASLSSGAIETSPHAWSRFPLLHFSACPHRNISTCVEQMQGPSCTRTRGRKHLHMRGADPMTRRKATSVLETSPHAWSRSGICPQAARRCGNISTCVEQIASS